MASATSVRTYGTQTLVPAAKGPRNPAWARDDAVVTGLTSDYSQTWRELAHDGVAVFDLTEFPTSCAMQRIFGQMYREAKIQLGPDAKISIQRLYHQPDRGAVLFVALNHDGLGNERIAAEVRAWNEVNPFDPFDPAYAEYRVN